MAPEQVRGRGEDDTEAQIREVVDLMVDLGLELEDETVSPQGDMARIRGNTINELLDQLGPEDQARAHELANTELAKESTEARKIQAKQPEARALKAITRLEKILNESTEDKFSREQIAAALEFQRGLSDRLTEDLEIKAQFEELCRFLEIDPADRDELWEKSRRIMQETNEQEE